MKYKNLIFILAIIFMSYSVLATSNEGTYYINMQNISQRLYSGEANVLIVGDSINAQTSTPRMFFGYTRRWQPVMWRGIVTQDYSGVSDQGTNVGNEPTAVANQTKIDPGESYVWNGTDYRNWNIKSSAFYRYTSDPANLGTALAMKVNTTFFNYDFADNKNLTTRFIYLASENSTEMKLRATLRDGTTTGAGGSPAFRMNKTTLGIYAEELNYTSGIGSATTGTILTYTTLNETILNAQFYPLASRVFINNISTGLQLDYAGAGGYTTKAHLREGENLTVTGINRNASYGDLALRQYMGFTDSNIIFIWLGQNSADDEWNGITLQNYSKNVYSIITRYRDAYNTAGYSSDRLYFVLVSQYDTSPSEDKKIMMESNLLNLSVNTSIPNIEIGMIRLRSIINDTNGTYNSWNNTYTADGIHPSEAGALEFATYMWNQINNSLTDPSGSLNTINWTAESQMMRNYSVSSTAIELNNTGLLNTTANATGLVSAVIRYKGSIIQNGINGSYSAVVEPGFGLVITNSPSEAVNATLSSIEATGICSPLYTSFGRFFESVQIIMLILSVVLIMGGVGIILMIATSNFNYNELQNTNIDTSMIDRKTIMIVFLVIFLLAVVAIASLIVVSSMCSL